MATQLGSIDLKSLKTLRDDVSQYFWFNSNSPVPSYGNGVHVTLTPQTTFASNPTGQNILMNTDGISIRNGLLPLMVLDNDSLDFNIVDTTQGTYTNVASFGATTTIGITSGTQSYVEINTNGMDVYNGNNNVASFGSLVRVGKVSNAPKVIIQDDDFAIYTEDGNIAFETYVPVDAPIAEQEITKTYTDNTYPLSSVAIETSSSYSTSNIISMNDITSIPSGTYFTLRINLVSYSRWTTDSAYCEFYFVKGTSSTSYDSGTNLGEVHEQGVDTDGVNYSFNVQYNGANTLTVGGSYQLANSNDGTMFEIYPYISMLVYTASGVPIPSTYVNGDFYANGTNIGSSYIMGVCYLEQSTLAQTHLYLGLDYHNDTTDSELYDTISDLGWDEDVIMEIIASADADIILVGGTTTTRTYTNPSGATIYWKSANPSIATVSDAGVITGVSVGDVMITAYMYVNGIAESTSFEIEVRTSYPT